MEPLGQYAAVFMVHQSVHGTANTEHMLFYDRFWHVLACYRLPVTASPNKLLNPSTGFFIETENCSEHPLLVLL